MVVKERPILFSAPMVRAILDGRKTQTRRVVSPQSDPSLNRYRREIDRFRCVGTDVKSGKLLFEAGNFAGPINAFRDGRDSVKADISCSFGQPGDRLWVRETHAILDCRPDVVLHDQPYPPTAEWPAGVYYSASDRENPTEPFEVQYIVPPDQWRPTYDTDHQILRPSIHMPRWASRITLEVTRMRVERLQGMSGEDVDAEGIREGAYPPARRINYANLWDSLNAKRGYGWDVNPWVWVVEFKRLESAKVAA